MGRSKLLTKSNRRNVDEERDTVISEIVQTVVDLSRRRVGALLVFERQTGLEDVIETGTRLNAEVSAPLLENIFEPNTPLHDGAAVIRDDQVIAAACILPLAEASGVSRELGTRHRAAVGISENTDAAVVVISEETGIVSMARDGVLKRPLSTDELKAFLNDYYSITNSGLSSFLRKLFKRRAEEGRA
jgi:diadenylate cyclase